MSAALIADKLRASLLQAAIQGKLTKQLPEDGDARDLLKEIEAEKARLIEEKVIKKEKPLLPITEDEIPFEIPENWVWVRLGDLANYRKGPFGSALTKSMFVPKGQNTIKVYEQKNAIQKNDSLGDYYIKNNYYIDKMMGFTLNGGDIIVSCAGTIGESYILPDEIELGIINQALMRVRCYSNILKIFYLHIFDYAIRSPLAVENVKGSAIKNIPPFEILKNIVVPLPPLSEQHRIVEAIETVLAKLDKLKSDENKLYDIQKAFPNKLRASLLQSAIQGQLTEQLPEDGHARDLLKEIEAEKARLIEEKIIKKEKPLPPITDEEIPFEIPENWAWVRLGDLCVFINGDRSSNYPIEKDFVSIGIPFFGAKDMIKNKLEYNPNLRFISEEKFESLRSGKLQHLDFVCLLRGSIGKYAIFPKNEQFHTGFINAQMVIIRTVNIEMVNYFERFFQSHYFDKFITEASSGTAVKQLAAETLRGLLVPLPPFAEQQRIVEKLDEILGKVDGLRKIAE